MSLDKITTLLGFAQKSNNLLSGNELVSRQLTRADIKLVLIATDVSPKSVEKLKKKCLSLNIPVYQILTAAQQSQAIGKANRMVIGVLDERFASKMIDLISDMASRMEVQHYVQN